MIKILIRTCKSILGRFKPVQDDELSKEELAIFQEFQRVISPHKP